MVDGTFLGRVGDLMAREVNIRAGRHRVEVRHPDYHSHYQLSDTPGGGVLVVKAVLYKKMDWPPP